MVLVLMVLVLMVLVLVLCEPTGKEIDQLLLLFEGIFKEISI